YRNIKNKNRLSAYRVFSFYQLTEISLLSCLLHNRTVFFLGCHSLVDGRIQTNNMGKHYPLIAVQPRLQSQEAFSESRMSGFLFSFCLKSPDLYKTLGKFKPGNPVKSLRTTAWRLFSGVTKLHFDRISANIINYGIRFIQSGTFCRDFFLRLIDGVTTSQ
ncbi:hypothetical protein T265_12777, partial [Opisthorchis viverrini]